MDCPEIDRIDHIRALRGLGRINWISGAARRMLRPILELASRHQLQRLSLLDVACGGADVPIAVVLGARARGLNIDLTLMDRSGTALAHAREVAERAGVTVQTVEADITAQWPGIDADVLTNSLFLHHLTTDEEVVEVLRRFAKSARRMLVISDLRRERIGLAAAWVGCHLLSLSSVVHHDGPASVRSAWTLPEMSQFLRRAGMDDAHIRRVFPARMQVIWERPPAAENAK